MAPVCWEEGEPPRLPSSRTLVLHQDFIIIFRQTAIFDIMRQLNQLFLDLNLESERQHHVYLVPPQVTQFET